MKDIRVVGIAVFGALVFATCAAKADTVVWYTFDDLTPGDDFVVDYVRVYDLD